jgi:hypothetical protein
MAKHEVGLWIDQKIPRGRAVRRYPSPPVHDQSRVGVDSGEGASGA